MGLFNKKDKIVKESKPKIKKPFYKRWWFIALVVFFILGGIGNILGTDEDKEPLEVSKEKEKPIEQEEPMEVTETEPKEVVPAREESIGTSDKDFTELTKSKASKMLNDVTGKWKKSTFAKSVDLNEYLISYNELHMKGSEVHVIVNFNYSTTTIVNDYGDRLSVRVHEYVKKEEHDAKSVGGGLLLGEYEIYKDNGDIIRID